jgi:hypothetical protein
MSQIFFKKNEHFFGLFNENAFSYKISNKKKIDTFFWNLFLEIFHENAERSGAFGKLNFVEN